MNTSRKKLCRICFAIVLALIVVLYCIMCCLEEVRIYEHCRETHDRLDLVFGKLRLLITAASVIVLTAQEVVLYKGVCYFLGAKAHTRGKIGFISFSFSPILRCSCTRSSTIFRNIWSCLFGRLKEVVRNYEMEIILGIRGCLPISSTPHFL